MKTYLAGEAVWRRPADQSPPRGVKMLLLNPSGVCVIGAWADWALAWAPLPKVQGEIKELLIKGAS